MHRIRALLTRIGVSAAHKLDELLRAEGKADSDLRLLDRREPEDIEAHREKVLR
jgi:hypothetical protein